jgi:hypothetical protein
VAAFRWSTGQSSATATKIALDTYTHSLVAFRLTLVSDTAVDVAMLLRDVMMPLPMRADWATDRDLLKGNRSPDLTPSAPTTVARFQLPWHGFAARRGRTVVAVQSLFLFPVLPHDNGVPHAYDQC